MGPPLQNITTLNNVYVYPNPFTPTDSYVTFRGLPTTGNVRIRIYNVAGELIIDKKDIAGNSWKWNTCNKWGNKVASGIYIYLITNNNQKITGKIGIIR